MRFITFDIITFGSATVDIFVDTFDRKNLTDSQKKIKYKHLISYPVGDKILINDLNITIGGGGTNTAVTFKRFGLRTGYCGCVGEDYYGMIIQEFLENEGIDFLGHETKCRTGTSIILDSIEHDRTILAFKGANDCLSISKIKQDKFIAKAFYFSSLLKMSFETQKKLMRIAEKKKIKVAFNPSCYQAKQGKKLKEILKKTNYLILNKEEAQYVLETESPHIKKLLLDLHGKLSKEEAIVVITDGDKGAHSFDGKDYFKVTAASVKVAEATGAGDAFASAFVSGILDGSSIEKSLQLGAANSQSVVTNKGAKEIILTRKEAEKFISKYKYKVTRV